MRHFVPYCGFPPSPQNLHWNYAPVLSALLILAPAVYLLWFAPARRQWAAFLSGWGLLALCFLSPLCPLGVALFSARATQHVLLMLIAAPLLAAGLPKPRVLSHVLPVAAAFAATVWIWHSPRLYDLTLENNVAYWAMNVMMIGSAVLFWRAVFASGGLAGLAGVCFVGLEMTLLGALIAFAGSPFYDVHAQTTLVWGLSQLDDQRLGGLILWVPAGLLGVAYSAVAFANWMTERERLAAVSLRE